MCHQQQFRVGLLRMERVVRERMTITDPEEATPSALINIRPVVAAMKEFFQINACISPILFTGTLIDVFVK